MKINWFIKSLAVFVSLLVFVANLVVVLSSSLFGFVNSSDSVEVILGVLFSLSLLATDVLTINILVSVFRKTGND